MTSKQNNFQVVNIIDLDWKMFFLIANDNRETLFLSPRLSVAIQRGMRFTSPTALTVFFKMDQINMIMIH